MTRVRETDGLRALVAQWVGPLARALPHGWSLAEWECEQGITLSLAAGDSRLDVELEARDEARPCFARTARFNVYFDALGGRTRGLDAAEREVLTALVAVLRAHESALPEPVDHPATERVAVRELTVDRGLVRDGPEGYYLNPYVGCMLACTFCYAVHRADFSRSLAGLPHAAWGRWVDAKVNLPEVIAREVRTFAPGIVRMSPIVTDPYQPIERRYRITRGCLEAMAGTGFEPIVLTRSSRVLDDLATLQRCTGARVGMSIPSDDDAMRAAFEPHTESVDARFEALTALDRGGVETFVIVQPMLPHDPERLADRIAACTRVARIGPLFEKPRALPIFRALGREAEGTDAWERAAFERLRSALVARGVAVNATDARWRFLR